MITRLIRRRRRVAWSVRRAHVAGVCRLTLTVLASATLALAQEPADGPLTPAFEHLRPIDALARDLLRDAWLGSASVQSLTETLEASDVFVQIEVQAQEVLRGRLRFMSGSLHGRWVRVTVKVPGRKPDLLATLAHELQHAVEIASESGARDRASVEALFRRIGFRRDEPQFETAAALAIERRVKWELGRRER